MEGTMLRLLAVTTLFLSTSIAPDASGITINVDNVEFFAENLIVTSVGATTATSLSAGYYVVGPRGKAGEWQRPIVPFPRTSFAAVAGLTLLSATLHYSILEDFTEPGESYTSEVRLFRTAETNLLLGNRDVFAGLTGDGGAHAVVGSVSLVDGVTGAQSLAFSAAALSALATAINGTDPTIGIAFREFVGDDILEEFVFGTVMSIEVTALDPVPVEGRSWGSIKSLFTD
jgi:hypothetical protein